MRRQLVYDLPTRLFHWLFAGLFLTAFAIAKTIDDDSSWFNLHSLAGLTLGFLIVLRLIWGVFGTQHARFSDFALRPGDLFNYFKGILNGDKRRWAGHNPASSWAALVMLSLGLGLAVTGYLMTSGPYKETFEDVHELFANGFVVVAALHVAGIALHTIRFKEMIGLSMLDGKKDGFPQDQTIGSSKPSVGILLMGLVVVFAVYLYKNYDSQTQDLQFFGTTLELGEGQGEDGGETEFDE